MEPNCVGCGKSCSRSIQRTQCNGKKVAVYAMSFCEMSVQKEKKMLKSRKRHFYMNVCKIEDVLV